MKNLILIRHSKSSWDVPMQDIDRPLSTRGVQDAHLVSEKLIASMPDKYLVWSSYSKRTSETALIFSQNLGFSFQNIKFKSELYTFECDKLLQQIKTCDEPFDSLVVFCHNEAVTELVNQLGHITFDNVPTTGVIQLQFKQNEWSTIENGTTTNYLFPSLIKNESN